MVRVHGVVEEEHVLARGQYDGKAGVAEADLDAGLGVGLTLLFRKDRGRATRTGAAAAAAAGAARAARFILRRRRSVSRRGHLVGGREAGGGTHC